MAYVRVLSVVVRHAFHGTGPAPVRLSLADGGSFDRGGGVVKARGARLDLYRPQDMAAPASVEVDVHPAERGIVEMTPLPEGGAVPVIQVDGTAGEADSAPGAEQLAAATLLPPLTGRPRLARLQIALPPGGAPARVTATLPSIATHWAYHVFGDAEGLDVVERDGRIAFSPAGETEMPDGRAARTWRSDTAISLRARQTFTVILTRMRDFGPEPVIAALPVPARPTSKPAGSAPGAVLQSDIYVTL